MATRRGLTRSFIILLSLSSALLSGDAIPQGYRARHRRAHKCQTCPRDCPEKLAGPISIALYTPPQPAQPAQPAQAQASYSPHPTPAPYAAASGKPPAQQYPAPAAQPYQATAAPVRAYQRVAAAVPAYQPAGAQYVADFGPEYRPCPCDEQVDTYPDPYGYPGYDCPYGSCRCGRSLDADDDYAAHGKYNGRSLDAGGANQVSAKPLAFADESSPPAAFYKNYRPYARDSDGYEGDSEEEPSRDSAGRERERLFVVYRADAFDDRPSDSELESVIRQAMDVARQQKGQESLARSARKPYRYRQASQAKRHNGHERVAARAPQANAEAAGQAHRFNLAPGPLLNLGETYVTEEGDDALNPGSDQSQWTVVPAVADAQPTSAQSEAVDEIEAAVSVVPEIPKTSIMTVPKVAQKPVGVAVNKDASKKQSIELVSTERFEKKSDEVAETMEDMPTPSTATESTNFEKPAEIVVTSAPTTDVATQ